MSYQIIGAAIEVHRALGGPGLLESVYEEALVWELTQQGLCVERQLELPIQYKGHQLASPLRVDLLVEKLVIVENKAVVIIRFHILKPANPDLFVRLTGPASVTWQSNFGRKFVKRGSRSWTRQPSTPWPLCPLAP
ncbi:MAG: GxxExxY protein [Chloroflexi bacterium]|nr:GxxExxY protein [Chloroflexota bacterium]